MPLLARRGGSRLFLFALVSATFLPSGRAQRFEVTVVGEVEAVYLSTAMAHSVYLVQLRVEEASLGDTRNSHQDIRVPKTNDTLFIVCTPGVGGLRTRLTLDDLPRPESRVRARVNSSQPGVWQPGSQKWFERIADTPVPRDPTDSSPTVDVRGMTCEAVIRDGRLAFIVKSVAESGPARDAGFQVGDVVAAVDGQPVNSVLALRELAAKTSPLRLSVIDVNTGQLAQVDLAYQKPRVSAPESQEESPASAEADNADRIATGLGIEVTVSRIGLRKSALAVAKVNPLGAAAEAGVEVGDVIMAVNDQPTASVAELAAALPSVGGKTTLLIRNVRGGDDVPVEVTARSQSAVTRRQPSEPQNSAREPGSTGTLGLTTELAFYKGEAAVRITNVERGSPAARAGLQTGWLIVEADGKPILHPDELAAAQKEGRGRLRLKVADPGTNRESEVEITR